MPYAGGVFSLYTPGNPVVDGTTIDVDWGNNTLSDIASGLSAAILKDGSQTLTANIPMSSFKLTGLGAGNAAGNSLRYEQLFTTGAVQLLGSMEWVKGADIASPVGGTLNLTTATGNAVHVTGTNAITAVTLGTGMWRIVIFDGILALTHHATTNNLPGAANITTAANDRALYWADGTTSYCVSYVRADGKSVIGALTSGTEQATTSGTAITFTGIPSWAKRVTIQFVGVSTNGTDQWLVQIGDTNGVANTGYLGAGAALTEAAAVAVANSTAGFIVHFTNASAITSGNVVLTLEDASDFTWTCHGVLARSDSATIALIGGRKSLAAVLDRVSVTTTGGTNAFDAGAMNILVE